MYCKEGDYVGAEVAFKMAVLRWKHAFSDEHRGTLRAAHGLGNVYLSMDRPADAKAWFEHLARYPVQTVEAIGPRYAAQAMRGLLAMYANDGEQAKARRLRVELARVNHPILNEDEQVRAWPGLALKGPIIHGDRSGNPPTKSKKDH